MKTTCTRDCPDACGIVASVSPGGRVTALKGDPDHPVTKGFLCFRTSRFLDIQYGPDRLRQPLLRKGGSGGSGGNGGNGGKGGKGGRLVPVTMDEALDVAAERLGEIVRSSGPAAIFHYRSGGSLGLLKTGIDRFFAKLGPVTTKIGDICSGAGEAAQELDFGISESNDLHDLENSAYIYLWGKNPVVSSVHLVPVLKAARARGCRITLIDPVASPAASLADRVVAPRPGSDIALALGIARVLLDEGRRVADADQCCDNLVEYEALLRTCSVEVWAERAGVPASEVAAMAAEFAAGPTAIQVGWGLQRRRNGAATVRALDALSAYSGNLFVPGGGCSFYYGRRTAFDSLDEGAAAARHVREPMFAADVAALKDPPIRAIWITAGNPVCMLPDAGAVARVLEETEFTVVVDPLLTDSGRRADLVLPVPTLLEDDDLLGSYGHHWLGEARPVVPPPPGVWHELRIYQELARRLDIDAGLEGSIDELKRRMTRRLEAAGTGLDELRSGARRNPFVRPVLFAERRVRTASGKVNLLTSLPEEPAAVADFPLWLFSNSMVESQCSQWSGRGLGEHVWVMVHPDAAGALQAGEVVIVESAQGRLRAELRLDAKLRRDVAVMPKGGHFDRGQAANTLVAAVPTDLGLGAAFLDCRVRLLPGA